MTAGQQREQRKMVVEELRASCAQLAEKVEAAERRDFHTRAKHQGLIDLLKGKLERAEQQCNVFDNDAEKRLQKVHVETEAEGRKVEQIQSHADQCDAESFDTVARLATSNQTLQRRVGELEKASVQRDDAHIVERCATRKEADGYARIVADLEDRIARGGEEHEHKLAAMRTESEELRQWDESSARWAGWTASLGSCGSRRSWRRGRTARSRHTPRLWRLRLCATTPTHVSARWHIGRRCAP